MLLLGPISSGLVMVDQPMKEAAAELWTNDKTEERGQRDTRLT